MHARAISIMRVGALYISIPFCMSCAVAQSFPPRANGGLPPLPSGMPGSMGATVAPPVVDLSPKLIYRDPNLPLTVDELATAQRAKLQEDFMKKAGYTSSRPVVVKPVAKPTLVVAPPPPKIMNSLVIDGIYGPVNAQKVELRYNGVLQILAPNGQIGKVKIESIQPGQVVVVFSKPVAKVESNAAGISAKPNVNTKASSVTTPHEDVRQTLKPGDVLEIPA